jgi:hypothetical protein
MSDMQPASEVLAQLEQDATADPRGAPDVYLVVAPKNEGSRILGSFDSLESLRGHLETKSGRYQVLAWWPALDVEPLRLTCKRYLVGGAS